MKSNETLSVIKRRRSVRYFKPEQVDGSELNAVIESGLYAPFAQENSKHFTVVQNHELLEMLNVEAKKAASTMDVPHLAGLGKDDNFDCLYSAPTLVLISGLKSSVAAATDCAIAAQNMLLASESLGLGSCYCFFVTLAFCGRNGESITSELKIPPNFEPCSAVLLGYKNSDEGVVPEKKWDCVTFI